MKTLSQYLLAVAVRPMPCSYANPHQARILCEEEESSLLIACFVTLFGSCKESERRVSFCNFDYTGEGILPCGHHYNELRRLLEIVLVDDVYNCQSDILSYKKGQMTIEI